MTTPGTTSGIRTLNAGNPCGRPFTGGLGGQVMIINNDLVNDIQIGYTSFKYGDPTAVDIAAGNAMTLTDSSPMYACTADPSITVSFTIVPGGGTYTEGAVQIATQLLPLAVDIAEAIAQQGISLLGAPKLLYDNSQPAPPGTPGLVGATISNSWAGGTEAQAISNVNGYMGIPLGNYVERVYYEEGDYPASMSVEPLAAIVAAGAKVQLCLKPLIADISNPASEISKIQSTISMFQAANVEFDIVLFTEPNIANHFTGAAQYQSYVAAYGPTIRNAGVKLIYNPASYDLATAESYYPGDSSFDVVSFDYYGTDYKNGIDPLTSDLSWTNNPIGLSEFNAVSAAGDTLTTAQWESYTNGIIEYFSTRLANGETNWDVIVYMGTNASTLNQINNAQDWKIPQIVAIYNALSSSQPGGKGTVINGGASKTLPPIDPSPGGGYAIANGVSYDITLNFVANASGSTNPFAVVQLNWFNNDALGAAPVAQQHWSVPIGETGSKGTIIAGAGPQAGQYLQVKVTNEDTIACTCTIQLNQTSRTQAIHDWLWDVASSVSVPGFQEADGGGFGNSLGAIESVSVNAGNSVSYLISMHPGYCYVRFGSTNGGSTDQLEIQVQPQPTSVWGNGNILDEYINPPDTNPPPWGQPEYTGTIILPRAPCLVTLLNNQSSGAANLFAFFVTKD